MNELRYATLQCVDEPSPSAAVTSTDAAAAAAAAATWMRRFKLIAWLEGASFLLLLGVAMPLKYWMGLPLAVRVVGMAHGVLFLLYSWTLLDAVANRDWRFTRGAWGLLAGLLPFGTFVFEARVRHAAGTLL